MISIFNVRVYVPYIYTQVIHFEIIDCPGSNALYVGTIPVYFITVYVPKDKNKYCVNIRTIRMFVCVFFKF